MTNPSIIIRPATIDDAPNIAWAVLIAVGVENITQEMVLNVSHLLCEREDTLYSWRNTSVAEINGAYAGSLTSYKGIDYKDLRSVSFPIMRDKLGCDFMDMENETEEGEYYLDSLAVWPEFRGKGIASLLIQNAIQQAKNWGIPRVTLVVDPDHTGVKRLYEKEGFSPLKMMQLFGQAYQKMYMDL